MRRFQKLISVLSAAAITFSMVNVSAAGAPDDLSAATAFDPVSVMDYDGDALVGANDCRRLQKFLLGAESDNKFYDFDADGAVSVIDQIVHKRTVMKDVPSELITETGEIPVKDYVSLNLFRKSIPTNPESPEEGEYYMPEISDCIIENRSSLEHVIMQYLLMDEETNGYGSHVIINEKYTDEFFEENSLVFVASDYPSSLLERLSLSDGLISVEYFFGRDYVYISDFMAIGVTVSKDVLARYDYSSVRGKNNTTIGDEGDCAVEMLPINGKSEKQIDVWIDSAFELKEFTEKELVGLEAGDQTALDKLISGYDERFFENHKLIVFSTYGMSLYNDEVDFSELYYDRDNIQVNIAVQYEEVNPELTNLYFIELDRQVCFDGQKAKININDLMAADKPVIYLYPEEEAEVTVSLDVDGQFGFVYPEFTDKDSSSWTVTASPDGTLRTQNGNEYSYLFWDATTDAQWDMSEGYVVKGSDTCGFFEKVLPQMGLTPKEYNDFIVYWVPLMQSNEYNFITFQTDVYEDYAKLDISPAPDSMLRVFMAYLPVTEREADFISATVPEPEITGFDREGFCAVEWGGTKIIR